MEQKFNLRVYGIVISPDQKIVVSDEVYPPHSFTKFPGGGMEWGEGPIDCLKREFREELDIDIEVGELIYFTDFFQQSAFRKNDQIVSIYYEVKWNRDFELIFANSDSCFGKEGNILRLVSIKKITINDLTFPIDKHVLGLLLDIKSI